MNLKAHEGPTLSVFVTTYTYITKLEDFFLSLNSTSSTSVSRTCELILRFQLLPEPGPSFIQFARLFISIGFHALMVELLWQKAKKIMGLLVELTSLRVLVWD